MKKRYQITHTPQPDGRNYGHSYRYTKLETAQRELAHSVPRAEWFILDRETGEKHYA